MSVDHQKIIAACGKSYVEALTKLIFISPIVVEIGALLAPFFSDKEGKDLPDPVQQLLQKMREDISDKYGVTVTGIRFRVNISDLSGAGYKVLIHEIPALKGELQLARSFVPGTQAVEGIAKSLNIQLEETTHPLTGETAWFIDSIEREKFTSRGSKVLDQPEYLILVIQALLESNLYRLFGRHETESLIKSVVNEKNELEEQSPRQIAMEKILEDDRELNSFTAVLKELLQEKVPVSQLEVIAAEFFNLREEKKDLRYIIESIRSLDMIKPELPGNKPGNYLFPLDHAIEEVIRRGKPNINHLKLILNAIYRTITGHDRRRTVLLVKDPVIRSDVKKLIEFQFSDVPVLSEAELLPELKGKFRRKIIVTSRDR